MGSCECVCRGEELPSLSRSLAGWCWGGRGAASQHPLATHPWSTNIRAHTQRELGDEGALTEASSLALGQSDNRELGLLGVTGNELIRKDLDRVLRWRRTCTNRKREQTNTHIEREREMCIPTFNTLDRGDDQHAEKRKENAKSLDPWIKGSQVMEQQGRARQPTFKKDSSVVGPWLMGKGLRPSSSYKSPSLATSATKCRVHSSPSEGGCEARRTHTRGGGNYTSLPSFPHFLSVEKKKTQNSSHTKEHTHIYLWSTRVVSSHNRMLRHTNIIPTKTKREREEMSWKQGTHGSVSHSRRLAMGGLQLILALKGCVIPDEGSKRDTEQGGVKGQVIHAHALEHTKASDAYTHPRAPKTITRQVKHTHTHTPTARSSGVMGMVFW